MKSDLTSTSARRARNPLARVVDLFDSIRLGIVLVFLILVYAAVGSAVPVARQYFELTEFAYFNHWIFVALIALFCVALTVVTVRRIPVNVRNLGVLTVHAGLLILCAGSVVYFGRKVEGSTLLEAPTIGVYSLERFRVNPQQALIGRLQATEGASWSRNIPMLGGAHRIEVAAVEHEQMRTGARVRVRAEIGSAPPNTIELRQATRDAPTAGIAQVNERLALWLKTPNISNVFYDDAMPALMVDVDGQREVFELPELPYYKARFVEGIEPIEDLNGRSVASAPDFLSRAIGYWEMPFRLGRAGQASASDWPFTLEIDGYIPYARLEESLQSGSGPLRPVANVRLRQGGQTETQWLDSQTRAGSSLLHPMGSSIAFVWMGDRTEIDGRWTRPIAGRHILEVRVPEKGIERTYDVKAGQIIEVEGTDYKLTIEELRPNWPLMTAGYEGARTPIALVWVEGSEQAFQRSVVDRYPELNQDRDRAGQKIRADGSLVDEGLELVYTDASRHRFVLFAGDALAPTVVHTAPGGKRSMEVIEPGEALTAGDDVALTLVDVLKRPEITTRPAVIPERNRRSQGSIRRQMSLIRVHVRSKDGRVSKRVWVPYSAYNCDFDDGTMPTPVVGIPGVNHVQLTYGRAVRRLDTNLTLERLETTYYPGQQQASGWTSYIRYEDPEDPNRRVMRAKVFLNNTARIGHWTFYQANAPEDGFSWTGLGVGNRDGVMTMLAGCVLISLGMCYAFAVKPVLVRRRTRKIEAAAMQKRDKNDGDPPSGDGTAERGRGRVLVGAILLASLVVGVAPAHAGEASGPAAGIKAIEDQIDLAPLRTLALQHRWRYSTIESWSRDMMRTVHGAEALYGLDPVVAAMELAFNAQAYDDLPVIYIKDRALRGDLLAHPVEVPEDAARKIMRMGMIRRSALTRPDVQRRLSELTTDQFKSKPMGRLFGAINHYDRAAALMTVVPDPNGEEDTPWHSIERLIDPMMLRQVADVAPAPAQALSAAYNTLRRGWVERDAAMINSGINELARLLPTIAPEGVYPSMEQRLAEVNYRRWNLMRWAWVTYIVAFFVSVVAVGTRYRWIRAGGLLLVALALGLHGYDLALRWQVIGRIPVANMYEAVVSSTWIGVLFGFVLELFLRKRVFVMSAALLGFFALSLPELVPNEVDNSLATMMPILDDIMLRIHTVLIIASYAVITLAFGVANCYLFVAAFRDRVALAQGTIGAQVGAIACLLGAKLGWFAALETWEFVLSMGLFIAGGALGAVLLLSVIRRRPALMLEDWSIPKKGNILREFDKSHMVLLYTAMVALFVGLVLGAVWADYSWGRPWGWDPKEVFALNTWLVYAILIHSRFVTKRRELWTGVLSVCGFAAMQFNWWVVNFYIVGLHSYA